MCFLFNKLLKIKLIAINTCYNLNGDIFMKKTLLLFITMFTILIGGCTIVYNKPADDNSNQEETPGNDNQEVTPPTNIEIDPDVLLYPSTLTLDDEKITNYNYIDSNLTNEYTIYSAYYSEEYDTIYIAYDSISDPVQTLKAKDLYEIEKHAINYFISDSNRSEDKEYLKAVRIYPDRLASSCRRGLNDESANNINGCADYGGKEAIIDLNATTSLEDFLKPKKVYPTPATYVEFEPMRDTFAHEYGHISTFYHMVYKNDENYEDYLKLRLKEYYDIVYPTGLPNIYSSSDDYTIQPEEILADDFVELFYNTSTKKENDTNEYTLNYTDLRNSLDHYSVIQLVKNNETYSNLYNELKTYYSKFLNYENRQTYSQPIVISSSSNTINYYESYSHIGNTANLKTINSLIDVNLIAVGETTINNIQYYRVILSNTTKLLNGNYNKKDVGKMFGYVQANNYTQNNTIKLYALDHSGNSTLNKNNIIPLENNEINKLYILPFYDFSYVLNTTNDDNYATMYDYLNNDLTNSQTYLVNIYSFGTLIN